LVFCDAKLLFKPGDAAISRVNESNPNSLPTGVRAIAALFALCGFYLAILALLTLASPGLVSMTAAAPLLFGLELAGPYMFLLIAVAAGAIAWGLLRHNNIMRHAAILAACAGVVMLIPSVSGAVIAVRLEPLAMGGLGIIVRVIVAWYLSQEHIAEMFKKITSG
jgi:ABC-type transport system involved in multi-copper enzyme maturation permease subunit